MSISKKSKALLSALACVLVFSGQANAATAKSMSTASA
jgi:hypothetical protein